MSGVDRAEVLRLSELIRDLLRDEDAGPVETITALGSLVQTTITTAWDNPRHRDKVVEQFTSVLKQGVRRRLQ